MFHVRCIAGICLFGMLCTQPSCVSTKTADVGSLTVGLSGGSGALAVDLYRIDARGRYSFLDLKIAGYDGVRFSRLPTGRYMAVVRPEVDSYGPQRLVATNLFMREATNMFIVVPAGTIRAKCSFNGVRAPAWWSPPDVAPIRVNRLRQNGDLDETFLLYLWIRRDAGVTWVGDLGFLREGTYLFTLFEREPKGKGVKDLVSRKLRIGSDQLNGGLVEVVF